MSAAAVPVPAARERPILFTGPMVTAIMRGHKTVTRRMVNPQPPEGTERIASVALMPPRGRRTHDWKWMPSFTPAKAPPFVAGQRLWVREGFGFTKGNGKRLVYRADGDPPVGLDGNPVLGKMSWSSPLFMPRSACRLVLEVVSVKVERLQEIDELGALDEGVEGFVVKGSLTAGGVTTTGEFIDGSARDAYAALWDRINGKRATWASSPLVWVVSFRRVTP